MCKVGVGVVAVRVTVCKADHLLIRGCDGDAGASKCTGFKYAGAAWEFGLAGAQQALVMNGSTVSFAGFYAFSILDLSLGCYLDFLLD